MPNSIPYPLELRTKRLLIRSPSVEDAPALREAIAETFDLLKVWMPWADHVPDPAEMEENCARAAQDFKDGKDFRLHLLLRDSGELIGASGLHRFDWTIPKFEIGYWVRSSQSGRGYITEAVAEITRFAFEELDARRVEIRTSTKNVRSWRVPDRLGFALEGILRNEARDPDGALRDTKIYAKTAQGKSE